MSLGRFEGNSGGKNNMDKGEKMQNRMCLLESYEYL